MSDEPAAVVANKPNVVLMLSDNIGYGDIGAFQGGEIRGCPTPKIDSIAAEGLTLTQSLVEAACTQTPAGNQTCILLGAVGTSAAYFVVASPLKRSASAVMVAQTPRVT